MIYNHYLDMIDKKKIKESIFLPKTNFSRYGKPLETQKKILEYWDKIKIYEQIKQKPNKKGRFLFHYGPPFVSGYFHAGHYLSISLKDTIARLYTMLGYEVPIMHGHDCHGLPIELAVQKKIGKEKLQCNSIFDFRKLCRNFAEEISLIHKKSTKNLCVLTGDKFYSTMDKDYVYDVYKCVSDLLLDSKIYLDYKPVAWSIDEQSTVAEIEIKYKEKISKALYIMVPIKESENKKFNDFHIIFWTTTPWTVISNCGVAYNKNIIYKVIIINKHKCLVSEENYMDFYKKIEDIWDIEDTEIIVEGKELENLWVSHPVITDKIVPLLEGSHVTSSTGTGFVHSAPDHGLEDYNLCTLKHGIKTLNYVDEKGYYKENTPIMSGLHIFKDENRILELLKSSMIFYETIEHSYPYSDRSNNPLIYISTPQIFIKLQEANVEEYIDQINWYPQKTINRIRSFVKNREGDWCTSRQRSWGVCLVMFMDKNGQLLKDPKIQKKILEEIKKNGDDHLLDINIVDYFLPEEIRDQYTGIYGIVDVWLESGLSWYAVIKKHFSKEEQETPVIDLILEGSDQHRGWFQSLLTTSVLLNKKIPYKNVITHGFIVDEKGEKLSKSKGNGIGADVLMEKYGVDLFRTWLISSDYQEDIKISENIIENKREILQKIRNVITYLIGATHNLQDKEKEFIITDEFPLEAYILHKCRKLEINIIDLSKNFQIREIFDGIFKFIQELSFFYLDVNKDILYCHSSNHPERQAVRKTLSLILEFLLKCLGPFLPILVEEAALAMNHTSYHIKNFETFNDDYLWEETYTYIDGLYNYLTRVRYLLEEARKNKIINGNNEGIIYIKPYKNKEKELDLITKILMVSKAEFAEEEKIIATKDKKCERCWKYTSLLDNFFCARCHEFFI
ncbi:isoleucine--tRNA ligase [Rickettsiales bacterium (ex Bugula neritina AB1)]|nr:isoleucine--tRNA ligase [Rickettsiales bacterium (ex Bugula neritina AB1)]